MITGFTAENLKRRILKPIEDSYDSRQTRQLIALSVADGITRDFKDGSVVDRNFKSLVKFLFGYYPNPSPAREVADLFTKDFAWGEGDVRERFRICNEGIWSYNQQNFSNTNFLENDLAGCVASGALVQGRDVSYGFICDSGLAVFDSKGNLQFRTENEGPNSKGSIDEDIQKRYREDFVHPEGRARIRREYRNNPSKPLAYGALTGQEEAMYYIGVGYRELKDGELVMLFTDGLENFLNLGEFIDLLRQGAEKRDFSALRKFCRKRVETEGTAVIYVPANFLKTT